MFKMDFPPECALRYVVCMEFYNFTVGHTKQLKENSILLSLKSVLYWSLISESPHG